jgi:aerobic carbon-monoxide dehydrogenase large subunit
LLDYALPSAGDVPPIKIVHQQSPSPLNPLGVKGVGEGGAVAPPAAIANAVCDALAPFGVEVNATPVRPEQLVRAARQGRPAPSAASVPGGLHNEIRRPNRNSDI